MRLRNLSRWTLNQDTQALLFFSQRIDELLFDYSLDTYKPPALNAPYLCKEAIELINEIEKGFIEPSSLESVIEELVWSLRHDPVAKGLLDAGVEYYTLHNEQTPLSITKLRLEVLERTINSERYIAELCIALREAIHSGEKSRIDLLSTNLVTSLINGGVSKQWLHDQTHEFFFSPDGSAIDSAELLDEFLEKIIQKVHAYQVFCIVSNLIERVKDSLSSFHFSIVDDNPPELAAMLAAAPLDMKEVVVRVDSIQARDPFSAREAALRKLDNLSDLFTLFYHRKRISWRPEVLVEWKCCAYSPLECGASKGAMEKAFDLGEERAAKSLGRMLKRFAARKDRDSFRRFNRVADLHGICVEHDIPENQLVNLWTAIETLVPAHVGASKIKQVITGVIPFTGVTYIGKTLQRLLFDLLVWDKWRTKKILNKVQVQRGAPMLHRLAILVVAPECAALREELYSRLGDFHLLRYRCFCLAKDFATSKGVINRLERHEVKVRWQLRRLYRARNLIVHTSRSPSYIKTLIENGHDYLDAILFEVIRSSCNAYQSKTIEQAFELTSVAYQGLKRDIQAASDFVGDRAVLLIKAVDDS